MDDPEGIYSVERMGLQSNVTLLQQKLHDILPMYYDFTGFLSSGTYPAANMLLSKMFISKKKYTIGNTGLRPDDMLAIDCLKQASLKEILSNDSLPDKVQARIFELEAGALAAYLSTSVAPEKLYQFSEQLSSGTQFEEITLEQIARNFQTDLGVDLLPFMDKLYQREGLPSFDIRDIQVQQIITDGFPKYQVGFKVWNMSDMDGVISILADDETVDEFMSKREGGIAVDFNMPLREKYYMIPAGVCKEVKFIMNGDHGYIGTNLAANFPGDYNIPLVKEGISKIREGMEGIWDIDRRFLRKFRRDHC